MKKLLIILAISVIFVGCGKIDNNNKTASEEVKTEETNTEIVNTSITGTWFNTGKYGENKLQILNPDNFIYTNPLGESQFGKWSKVYGDTYNLTYSDGSEGEATLKGDILDYVGADWKKK